MKNLCYLGCKVLGSFILMVAYAIGMVATTAFSWLIDILFRGTCQRRIDGKKTEV